MSTEEKKATVTVAETGRVAVMSTWYGPTNHRGSRIKVKRADDMGGKTVTVSWDYSIGIMENHAEAIKQYLEMMNWGGVYTVGATANGAVAVWKGWA
jgi:hypothetical protein